MNQPQPAAARRKRPKGPRPKHVPQRTCVSCREKGDKRGLIRIVRTPDRAVVIDPGGKANGRGAYLCHKTVCWERAIETQVLSRALNIGIADETKIELKKYAATLGDSESSDRTAAAS